MKLLLVLLVEVMVGTFFAGSSNAHAKNGTTRAEIKIFVPIQLPGFPDPTTRGGVGQVQAEFNDSHIQIANENNRGMGSIGVTLDAVSDVRQGTVTAHLTTTLFTVHAVEDRNVRSSTPPAFTDIYLEDEFLMTAGTSGLPNGTLVNVDFLSTIIGQIDIDEGGNPNVSRPTYVSELFDNTTGGRPIFQQGRFVEHR